MAPNCEGNLAFIRLQEDLQRPPPYLRRNLRKALMALTTRTNPSNVKTSHAHEAPKANLNMPFDGEERPSKRRKMNAFGSGIPTLPPSKFYGSARAPTPASRFWAKFASSGKPKVEFQPALRVEISKITANREEDEVELSSPVAIRCLISVSIYYANSDTLINGESPSLSQICRQSQYAKMTLAKIDNVVIRSIDAQPFVFSTKDFLVPRKMNLARQPDDITGQYRTHDLADKYNIHVVIQCTGSHTYWPGLHPTVWDTISAEYAEIYYKDFNLEVQALLSTNPGQQKRARPLSFEHRSRKQMVPYSLHLQTMWSKPYTSSSPLPLPPPLPTPPPSISERCHVNNDLKQSQQLEEEVVEDSTNSGEGRARRARPAVDTYNLKTLSAQAQGKSPRKRKARESTELDEIESEARVTFSFGRADSVENGVLKQHRFIGLRCPFCDCNNASFDQLRFHLHNDHDNFKFTLRRQNQNPSRYSFFVEVIKSRSGGADGRTLQLGNRPATLFDLEKYLNGDNSWVQAREGPNHNHWPDHMTTGTVPINKSIVSSFVSSSANSCHSSPNTSAGSVGGPMDMDSVSKSLTQLARRVVVPNTRKPLFHTITKRRLVPGEELNSDDEKDESWFHQKHRDMLNDFEDVDPDEKEYLIKWNQFAMDHDHSVDVLLPNTVSAFVNGHKAWLATLPQKFMAHMGVLILQGVVTESQVTKWVKIIRESKAGDVNGEHMAYEPEKQEPKYRGVSDCICLEHAPLHDRVVCVGRDCKGRFFHKACSLKLGVPSARRSKWKCNVCIERAAENIMAYA